MDVRYFLLMRLNFIRQFYQTASAPYLERKRKITNEEEPFVPEYSEDGEPAFMIEWNEADDSLQILTYLCITMLTTALHLYFQSWVKERELPIEENSHTKKGWLAFYKERFMQSKLKINFDEAPVDLKLIEEIILARNNIQHPSSIVTMRSHYKKRT